MRIAVIIIRLLMGAMFLFASVTVLFKLQPQPELTGNVKVFMEGMVASGYLLTAVKIVELICALAFLSGRFVPLATVMIFPVIFNILMFHAFLEPNGLLIAVLLMVGNLFLAWYYRERYRPLLSAK